MVDVITVENVYKQYTPPPRFQVRTITHHLGQMLRRADRSQISPASIEPRFVLKDINFSLASGQALGLIGHNGSGKTTMLRLLAGVSLPTKGRIRVAGRVIPLLSLGAGFHFEMTGRENLYLNCTLMGLSRQQTADRIEAIIDFADIGEYVDVPIKRYSSGMLARLGFAAAVHMDAEIILIDEVLSVGDYAFSVKALTTIREFIKQGTVVYVSHDLTSVERLCDRVIWLDHGEIRGDGAPSETISAYTYSQQNRLIGRKHASSEHDSVDEDEGIAQEQTFDPNVLIETARVLDSSGATQKTFETGSDITIRVETRFQTPMSDVRIVLGIVDIETKAVVTACDNQLVNQDVYSGEVIIEAKFPKLFLRPRSYGIYVGISNPKLLVPLATLKDFLPRFTVTGSRRDPDLHYFAPQADVLFTPGVQMHVRTEYS